MSLELAISKLTDAVIEQNAKLDIMLAKTGAAKPVTAAAEEGEDKPKRTRASASASAKKDEGKDATGSDEGDTGSEQKLTKENVKALAVAWMAEFKKDETDPETEARKLAIKAALAKLMKTEGATITDVPDAELHRVVTWVENQKKKDNGFGIGRLTKKPSSAAADEGEAEDEI